MNFFDLTVGVLATKFARQSARGQAMERPLIAGRRGARGLRDAGAHPNFWVNDDPSGDPHP